MGNWLLGRPVSHDHEAGWPAIRLLLVSEPVPAVLAWSNMRMQAGTDAADDGAAVVEIYTDGACSPNPGPGGWGAILRYGRHRREIHGGEPATTNNRMEIMAAIRGLESLTRSSMVHVHTDSQYLRRGITEWLPHWQRNGWLTTQKKPVKNADLWQRLDVVAQGHDVQWFWVKGHAGHPENERADALACQGAEEAARAPAGTVTPASSGLAVEFG